MTAPRIACQAYTESRKAPRGAGTWTLNGIAQTCEACGGTGYRPDGSTLKLIGPRTGASTIGTIQAEWNSMGELRRRGEA